jgi:hypothetical protein
VESALHSPARVSSLGKYLAAQSAAFPSLQAQAKGSEEGKTSAKAKRLFVIFLISDLFHHDGIDKGQSALRTYALNIKPHLRELFAAASDLNVERDKSITRQIHLVLDWWKEQQYFSDKYLDKLRTIVESGGKAEVDMSDDNAEEVVPSISKPRPYMLPALHGDDSSPWFHQPAGVFLHEMAMSPGRPIDPKAMKPLKLKAGPAPDKLVDAVRDFMDDVAKIGTPEDMEHENIVDIDALGRLTLKDPETGDLIKSETYYGWSRDFARTIAQFRGKKKCTDSDFSPVKRWYIPIETSQSLSPSPLPNSRHDYPAKEKHNDNPRTDLARGRRVSSYRSKSHDRSRSPYGRNAGYSRSSTSSRRRRYSRSGSSRSRSSSKRRPRYHSGSRSRSRSYSPRRSRSPSRSARKSSRSYGREDRFSSDRQDEPRHKQDPPYQRKPSLEGYQQQRLPPVAMGAIPPAPPMGMPLPPPRPANWQGPWPPPPPPPNLIPGQVPFPPFAGAPVPPHIFGGGPVPPNFPSMLPNMAPPIPSQWGQPYPPPPNYGHQAGQKFERERGSGQGGYKKR